MGAWLRRRPKTDELAPYRSIVEEIDALEPGLTRASDREIDERALTLRRRAGDGVELGALPFF